MTILSLDLLGVILLGMLAGWIVNLLADTIPARRTLRQTWDWPLWRLGLRPSKQETAGADEAMVVPPLRRYLLVWLAAIGLGWLAYGQLGWTGKALLIALEAWFFLAIAVIDLEHRLVLNRMLLVAAPFVIAANLLIGEATITSILLGAVLGFGLLLVMALLTPGGIGMGDVKLAGVMGLATGLSGILFALSFGIFAGGIAAIAILVRHRFRRGQTMAYAPYLVVGVWVVLFDGVTLLYRYLEHLL